MLKDDEKLKELDTRLAFYCKEKNYSLVVSIMEDDIDQGNVLACNGEIGDLLMNICLFAKSIEERTKVPFRKFLVKPLIDSLDFDENKNITH